MMSRLTRCFAPSSCCTNKPPKEQCNGQEQYETEALCDHRSANNATHTNYDGQCDESHYNKNSSSGKKSRVKSSGSSSTGGPSAPALPQPSIPADQIFEADSQYGGGVGVLQGGGNGATSISARGGLTSSSGGGGGVHGPPAPHHPLLHECGYGVPRHRHAATTTHHTHRHGIFTGGGGNSSSHSGSGGNRGPPPLQLNTFGASSDEASWTKIDLASFASRAAAAEGRVNSGHPNTMSSPPSNHHHNETSPTPSQVNSRKSSDYLRCSAKYEKIDRIAMALFPVIFFLFNVCYWSYFLLLADALQDFW